MELSSAESALRTLKHRAKVPQGAVAVAEAALRVLSAPSAPGSPTSTDTAASDEQRRAALEQELATLLLYGQERWEPIAVFCAVVRDLMARHLHVPDFDENADFCLKKPAEKLYVASVAPLTDAFLRENVKKTVHQFIEHWEPRVRMSIAKLLGVLASWDLPWVAAEFMPQVVDSVECNLTRSPDFEETGFDTMDDNVSMNGMETPPQSPESTPRTPSTPYRLDDVSGWKALESSLCALKYVIKGSRAVFLQKKPDGETFVYLTPSLLELMTTKSCFHINRHVRVVGLDIVTAIADVSPPGFLDSHHSYITDRLCKCIMRGMQDNWSQVRYAASITVRAFLRKLGHEAKEVYYPSLVPRLCFNRYFVAERVQKHSQETWRLVMGEKGRQICAKYAVEIVDYYVDMTGHCVREAACQCIAELGTKVEPEAVRPHVARLMEAVLKCFYDASNLVRDAACLAAGQLVLGFPEECRPFLDELYHLWIDHLSDDIWSVREDAAIALGNAIRAYGQEALDRVIKVADEYLLLAKKQPAMSQHEYDEMIREGKKHLRKQAFGCCDLDMKSFDRHEHHHSEPWEHTDGAIYLVRELCDVAPDVAVSYLPLVADVAILRHFPQTAVLQETVWKQVPLMCAALGKKEFKRHLEVFFDPLVFTLQGSHRLATFAARDCVARLSKQIGPSIFLGRLQANPAWLEALAPLVSVAPPLY